MLLSCADNKHDKDDLFQRIWTVRRFGVVQQSQTRDHYERRSQPFCQQSASCLAAVALYKVPTLILCKQTHVNTGIERMQQVTFL